LAVIDRQSRRLVNGFGALALALGVWFVWVDMLPALKFLDRWQLYSYAITTSDAPQVGGDGATTKNVETTHWEWITAADLASAAIILLMAFIAAHNLPGLLEITCLQWLPIDSGARYAATTVARYLIHIATIIAVCNVVGLQWSSIQWLAAAATVGLGFGLQEIFANFISGLIILFERPIRVGDTVTIGDVTGTVSRIRSRATTIVDGDRKELIVPNKEFITGHLMNWTLSDDVLRTVLRVGVNHDTDVQRAAQLLLDAAESNPLVLRDPEPSVACTQLGEQQLEFELRVFSSGTASLSPLRHQLNVAILQAFHQAGIMLASPPRELVLRALEDVRSTITARDRKAA
jgi:potassium efflux system protein